MVSRRMMLASGSPNRELLLVESHPAMARSLRTGLEEEGFLVHAVDDAGKARDLLSARQFAVIIVDIAADTELTELPKWRQACNSTPLLILSAPGNSTAKRDDLGFARDAFLAKPFAFDDLLNRLALLIEST